jgi:hypothetical protein
MDGSHSHTRSSLRRYFLRCHDKSETAAIRARTPIDRLMKSPTLAVFSLSKDDDVLQDTDPPPLDITGLPRDISLAAGLIAGPSVRQEQKTSLRLSLLVCVFSLPLLVEVETNVENSVLRLV